MRFQTAFFLQGSCLLLIPVLSQHSLGMGTLLGEIVDSISHQPIPARVYLKNGTGEPFLVETASADGSAVAYEKNNRPGSQEVHTTLSPHPFLARLSPGEYELTVEFGKEYFSQSATVEVSTGTSEIRIELDRWVDMAARGWYSGDTHVHRRIADLPNILLAENLNVAFPLTYWVWISGETPSRHDDSISSVPEGEPVYVDETHAYYPMNTEYEIGTVDGKRHTLGAFFVLNHQTPFQQGVPPVGPVAEEARRQGGFLELDKHNWPWSMMLVPVMKIDLFELSNNHLWRTNFHFKQFGVQPPPEMSIEMSPEGFTERGWLEYGYRNYYALLNCGYRLRPTAGTASGVHPVPLGYGRVYVRQPTGFSYESWVEGLLAGRSFVTTGPMMFLTFNGKDPGTVLQQMGDSRFRLRVEGELISEKPLSEIEIVKNGNVFRSIPPSNRELANGSFENLIEETMGIDGSSWLAIRCIEPRGEGRFRFAHSSPVHVEMDGKPLRSSSEDIEFLIHRVQSELERNREVLDKKALSEYQAAINEYQSKLQALR